MEAVLNLPQRMTRQQAADYLGLKRATLERWACVGKGPGFYKMGSAVRYDRAVLDAYLESAQTGGAAADQD